MNLNYSKIVGRILIGPGVGRKLLEISLHMGVESLQCSNLSAEERSSPYFSP